jgi:O-antigen ligase
LVTLPLLLGGARPWFWSGIATIFFVGLLWPIWSGLEPRQVGIFSRKWLVGLSLLLLYPLFQCLPLTASWLGYLSPHLMQWKAYASDVALAPSRYFSISYVPLVSFISGLWWIFLVGYALLFRKALREEAGLDWFYHILFWVAGFEALYGLLQTLIPSLGVLWEAPGQGWARGTFVNHNHYAAFLGMIWPVLLAYLLSVRTASEHHQILSFSEREQRKTMRQKNLFLGFVIGLVLLGLFFSQSRAGISGALIALTVFVALGKKWSKKGLIALLVGSWFVMFVYGSIIGFHETLARFDELEKDAPSRLMIWADTWNLIRDHWLTGTGLGTYPEVIRLYQSHLTEYWDIVHAHNDYLELAGDLGAPMAAAMVLLVWGYWWVCAIGMVSRREARSKEKGVGSAGGVRSEQPAGIRQNAASREADGRDRALTGNRVPRGRHGTSREASLEYGPGALEKEVKEKRRLLALGALAGGAAFLCHSWVEFNWQIPANQLYFIVLLVLMKI